MRNMKSTRKIKKNTIFAGAVQLCWVQRLVRARDLGQGQGAVCVEGRYPGIQG